MFTLIFIFDGQHRFLPVFFIGFGKETYMLMWIIG